MGRTKIIFFVFSTFVLFFLLSNSVYATHVQWHPLVQCGLQAKEGTPVEFTRLCTSCDTIKLAKNLIDFILLFLVPIGGTLLIFISGFMILLGGANPSLVVKGKAIFTSTIIGIVIIASSWLIVNFLLKSIVGESDIANKWYQIQCVSEVKVSPVAEEPTKEDSATGDIATFGTCQGVVCQNSKGVDDVPSCGPVVNNCSISSVNSWDSQITAAADKNSIGSGIDTVSMVKAIMAKESGGNSNAASGADAFGLMQLQVGTANSFKSGCVDSGVSITKEWLLNPDNAEASICIAINRIKSLVGVCGTSVRDLAAGYNGGETACQKSESCASCAVCGGEETKKWECIWDGADGEHQVCNADREVSAGSSFFETRQYAPQVEYCYNQY